MVHPIRSRGSEPGPSRRPSIHGGLWYSPIAPCDSRDPFLPAEKLWQAEQGIHVIEGGHLAENSDRRAAVAQPIQDAEGGRRHGPRQASGVDGDGESELGQALRREHWRLSELYHVFNQQQYRKV